jgi:hypothetical protein
MERVELCIGARQLRRSVRMNGAQHVVIGQEMSKAQVLEGQPESPNSAWISCELDLWIDSTYLHVTQSVTQDR